MPRPIVLIIFDLQICGMRYLHFIIFLLFTGIGGFAQPQGGSQYYYFGNKKILLKQSTERIYLRLPPGEVLTVKQLLKTNFQMSEKVFSTLADDRFMVIRLSEDNKAGIQKEVFSYLEGSNKAEIVRMAFTANDGKDVVVDERFYVKLKSHVTVSALQAFMAQQHCEMDQQYQYDARTYLIKATAANDFDGLRMANKFYESGLFEYSEPDFRTLDMLHEVPPATDPLYNRQWAHLNDGSPVQFNGTVGADMDVDEAWAVTMGSPSIRIAVIDEGVQRNHPDLLNNIDPLGFGLTAGNATTGDILSTSRLHGTACAGIIAAEVNNGIGIAGVAPLCKIIPVNLTVNSTGTFGTSAQLAQCIDWSWNQGGADIISNSWGGGLASSLVRDAIIRATTLGRSGKGSIVLFSSGNDDAGVSNPAIFPETIAVGAMSMCYQRKSPGSCDGETFWGSNYGVGLDISAPGVKIATTVVTGTGTAPNPDYNLTFNGTSAACPMVAGVAGLVLSVNSLFTETQVREILERSAKKVGLYTYSRVQGQPNGSWAPELGYGMVNANNAVLAAQNPAFCRVDIAANGNLQVCSGSSVQLQVTNPLAGATYEWRLNGTILSTGTSINAAQSGNYDVLLTTAGGCKDTSYFLAVQVSSASGTLVANAGADTTICPGAKTFLGGGPAGSGGTAILHPMRGMAADIQNNQFVRFNPLQPAIEYNIINSNFIPGFSGGNFFSGAAVTPYGLYMISRADRMLMKIDTATGSAMPIGVTSGTLLFNGMTYDATVDKIFAVALVGTTNQLFQINRQTGIASFICNISGLPSNSTLISLGADNSGQLFGYRLANGANNSAVFYRINKTTGVATFLGNTGFQAAFAQGGDVDPVTDQHYQFVISNPIGTSSTAFRGRGLWKLDKTNGQATLAGSIGMPENSLDALAFAKPEYKFQWSPTTHLSNPADANPQFSATVPGIYTYTLTVTDLCGNTASDEVMITVHPFPTTPVITPAVPVLSHRNAFTETLSYTQEAGIDYVWLRDGVAQANTTNSFVINFNNFLSNQFSVRATSAVTGCAVISAQVQYTYSPGILMNTSAALTVCDSSFYDAGGPAGNTSTSFTRTFTPQTAGTKLKFTLYNLQLANAASLIIYDGPGTSSPIMETLTNSFNGSAIREFIASNTSGILTIQFVQGSSVSQGWLGGITCIQPRQYRTVSNGLWTSVSVWESKLVSEPETAWTGATRSPNKGDDVIMVRHNISVPAGMSLPMDQTIVEPAGVLTVPSTSSISLYNDISGYELEVAGILNVDGNISGSSGPSLFGKITLTGTLNLQGSIITDSLVVKSAATSAVINAGGTATLGKLQVNNPAGLTINGNLDLQYALDLIQGVINIPSPGFVRMVSGYNPVIQGGSATSYINGKLRWQSFITYDPLKFPVGKNGKFRMIEILPEQTSTDYFVEYEAELFSGPPAVRTLPGTFSNVNQAWYHHVTIISGNGFFTNATATIHYDATDGVTNPASLRIGKDDGDTNWIDIGGSGSGSPSGSITSNSFTSFSDFILANLTTSTLPVTLLGFQGSVINNYVQLHWNAENEINFSRYEIEKSINGTNFYVIGSVTARGSMLPFRYLFNDMETPASDALYYRLKLVDTDGHYRYSNVILIKVNTILQNRLVQVYPNPIMNKLTIQYKSAENENMQLQLLDMNGRILKQQNIRVQLGVNQFHLDTDNYPSGFYLLQLQSKKISFTEKIIKL